MKEQKNKNELKIKELTELNICLEKTDKNKDNEEIIEKSNKILDYEKQIKELNKKYLYYQTISQNQEQNIKKIINANKIINQKLKKSIETNNLLQKKNEELQHKIKEMEQISKSIKKDENKKDKENELEDNNYVIMELYNKNLGIQNDLYTRKTKIAKYTPK